MPTYTAGTAGREKRRRKRRVPASVGERSLLLVSLASIVALGGSATDADIGTAAGSAGARVGRAEWIKPAHAASGDATSSGRAAAGATNAFGVGVEGGVAPGTVARGDRNLQARGAFLQQALRGGRVRDGKEEEEEEELGGREDQHRRLPVIFAGTLGGAFDVRERASSLGAQEQVLTQATVANPPEYNSTLCMAHWGMPELQHEPDPNGYVVYVYGREQLGGNKFLVSDGMFMAKALGRTFVEYPVKDARVVLFEEASLGLGAYWDLSELCMYNRILDLRSFRNMVADGRIPPEAFTTIRSDPHEVVLKGISDEEKMRALFKGYQESQVIVMEWTWKSGIDYGALQYLRPNPFYMGIVRMLLEAQQDWVTGGFIAVQWRTELSNGNLTECYQEIKAEIEHHRLALGYGAHQVLFNTDLYGKTSGTYKVSQQQKAGDAVLELINQDYPQAIHNEVHRFLLELEDSGVRAFVSGLAVASAEVMISSSLNDPETKNVMEAYRCQKPYSGYITLITEWRKEILHKAPDSVIRMFPFELPPPANEPEPEPAP